MGKKIRRKPRNYDGVEVTSRHFKQLLPSALHQVEGVYQQQGDLVLSAWGEIVGERLAGMAEAASFVDGVLTIIVKNSTLYSLFTQHEKPRLLDRLRKRFPGIVIKTIRFRMG